MRLFKKSSEDKLRKAEKIISKHFEGLAADSMVEPIQGGASNRDYYRVFLPRMPVNNTGILMLMNKRFNLKKFDYYQVSELLRKLRLPVPQIFQEFSSDGALYLQDVGQVHLHDLVTTAPEDTVMVEGLYRQAIDHLIILQTRAQHYSEGVNAFQRAFDEEKLRWEMAHMERYFMRGFCDLSLNGDDKTVFWKFIDELCQQIAALPRVFCHRDYHSLNLMLWMEQLYIIDFQDARMGPCLYDLVSLLGDSYVDLGSATRYALLKYFAEQHPEYDPEDMKKVYEEFTLIAIQRHLKHLGTFGYLYTEKGFEDAIRHVPLTINYLRENISKFEELQEPGDILRRLFDVATATYNRLNLE